METARRVGIRWTIGDVSRNGFEALRLSIWGAWKLFGPEAAYGVCVNTVSVDEARAQTGTVPEAVRWHAVSYEDVPPELGAHLTWEMAEGTAWKLVPLRLFPDRYELALDNDCILWGVPAALRTWLADDASPSCVLAEDVRPCANRFSDLAGDEPRNAGIRGLPPGSDFEDALREILTSRAGVMTSELDEQGLQTAAVSRVGPVHVVGVDEVSICSPFHPHRERLGTRGAHFVGLNAREMGWSLKGRPAVAHIREHWARHRPAVYERVGIDRGQFQRAHRPAGMSGPR